MKTYATRGAWIAERDRLARKSPAERDAHLALVMAMDMQEILARASRPAVTRADLRRIGWSEAEIAGIGDAATGHLHNDAWSQPARACAELAAA